MASLKTVLYLGACLSIWIITPAETNTPPKAENVHWVSLDFKTVLKWTAKPSEFKFTVQYSEQDGDWKDVLDCTDVSHMECDLTNALKPYDRFYTADIKTEPLSTDYDYELEELPHTESEPFNPYRQSNISTVTFNLEPVSDTKVMINITDPLSGIHEGSRQLTIRDILKDDLKYAISYYKSGSTGVRDITSDLSTAEVSSLDAGESYCFMVAAFIPSRPKAQQLGPGSNKMCIEGSGGPGVWSTGAWVGVIFILLAIIIIAITVSVLCCKRKQNPPNQSSAPI